MKNNYDCDRCGYSTKSSQNLKLHFKRKNKCAPVLSDVEPSTLSDGLFGCQTASTDKKYKCEYCEKTYASVESRCNHKKICKKRTEENVSVKEQLTQLSITVEEQQKQIIELKSQTKTSITNQTNIGMQQNITINAFGKEDIAYLTSSPEYKKFMIGCLNDTAQGMLTLTDAIYYNKDHPENRNIKKTNKKDNFVKVYDGVKWKTTFAKETVMTIFGNINHELNVFLELMEDNDARVKDTTMKRFMETVGNALGYDFSIYNYDYGCDRSEFEMERRKEELIALELNHINERTKE